MIDVLISGPDSEKTAHLIGKAAHASGQHAISFSLQNQETSHVKISKSPFLSRDVQEADYIIVTGEDVDYNEILKKARQKAIVIVNTLKKPASRHIKAKKLKIKTIDATSIAMDTIASLSLAPVMLGALVKQCDLLTVKGSRSVIESPETAAFDEGYKR